jgi:undecaprenyl diphosphate synthase
MPGHVAIIMDGNGRWARRRFMPRLEGHRRGAKSVRRAVEYCRKNGIRYLTLYAFSTENWKRPRSEVSGLMELLSQFLDSEIDELDEQGIRFLTIGEISDLPAWLQDKIERAKERTANNTAMTLLVALSYGGRAEILRAVRLIARRVKAGELDENSISEETVSEMLYTHGVPDPDLLIRTGGEVRVSNFLLWQIAYTELYFTETLWPDFDEGHFDEAVAAFHERQRRFGMTSEQVESNERTP